MHALTRSIVIGAIGVCLGSVQAAGGPACAPEVVGSLGGPSLDVRVSDRDIAFVAAGFGGLLVIDGSFRDRPEVIGTLGGLGAAGSVALTENQFGPDLVAIGAGVDGLHVIDVQDPEAPTLLATLPTNANDVAIDAGLAFVADQTNGLRIVDLSDRANPVILGGSDTPFEGQSVDATDGLAFVVDGAGQALRIFDVSNPASPVMIGAAPLPASSEGVTVGDRVVYVAAGEEGVLIFDTKDPSSPTPIGSVFTSGFAVDVTLDEDLAYVAEIGGVRILDVDDDAGPNAIGFVATPGSAHAGDISRNTLFVADASLGLRLFDVSDPRGPVVIGGASAQASAVDVNGDLAMTSRPQGAVDFWDASDPTRLLHLAGLHVPGEPADVALGDGVALVSSFGAGLVIIDLGDPLAPSIVATVSEALDGARGLAHAGSLAFIADDDAPETSGGLRIVDVSDPQNPALLGQVDLQSGANDVALAGGYAIVVSDGVVRAIDVSDPAKPFIAGALELPGNPVAEFVTADGARAYLSTEDNGLLIIDVSNPEDLMLQGQSATIASLRGADVSDDIAYVGAGSGGLAIFDVRNPADPRLLDRLGAPEGIGGAVDDVVIQQGLLFLASDRDLLVVRAERETAPIEAGSITPPAGTSGVALRRGLAYLADEEAGLQILEVDREAPPRLLSTTPTLSDARDLAVSDRLAFVVVDSGLEIFDVIDARRPSLIGSISLPPASTQQFGVDVALGRDVAFVTSVGLGGGAGGIEAFLNAIDLSDPANPMPLSRFEIPPPPGGLAISDGVALVGGENTLDLINVEDPANLSRLSRIEFAGRVIDVAVQGRTASLALQNGRLLSVDFNDPTDPVIAARLEDPPFRPGGADAENDLLVVGDESGVLAFDISARADPRLIGVAPVIGAGPIAIEDELVGVGGAAGLTVLDLEACREERCLADLSADGVVGPPDLSLLLADWGGPGPGDLDGSGAVGPLDLALLFGSWGPCPGR